MIKNVTKEPKVTICRQCSGNGHILSSIGQPVVCPQCEGSGRCVVSCQMTLNIEPFKPKLKNVQRK